MSPEPETLAVNTVAMRTIDDVMDSEGDTLSRRDSSSMTRDSQAELESFRNDQRPEKQLISSNSLRSEAESPRIVNLAHDRKERSRMAKLQCSKCSKLRRTCQGEPGRSCPLCDREGIRCSFLDPRPFRCQWCQRDYAVESALKGHITRSHDGQIQRAPALNAPEEVTEIHPSQSNVRQMATSPEQHQGSSESPKNSASNFPHADTAKPSEQAQPRVQRWPDGIHPLSQVPWPPQRSTAQNSRPGDSRATHPESSTEQDQQRSPSQNQDQGLPRGVTPAPKPYHELNFEIFGTYEQRNLNPNYVRAALDGIRDDIEQYSDFVLGKDRATSEEVRDQLRFLDDVRPLVHLPEIAAETSEMYGVQQSRLVIMLRSMFAIKDHTRLEEGLAALGPAVRLLRLPDLLCAILAYYLFQFFDERDPLRAAELRATELTHGPAMAAATIQHARLHAQRSYTFQARLENRAKKLAPSLYDLIRPLAHWQQQQQQQQQQEEEEHEGPPRHRRAEQHVERLERIILNGLGLAAELEARRGVFTLFWPACGERFDAEVHVDEADESDESPPREGDGGQGRERRVAVTLMPGAARTMEGKKLVYAKAITVVTWVGGEDGL